MGILDDIKEAVAGNTKVEEVVVEEKPRAKKAKKEEEAFVGVRTSGVKASGVKQ